MLMKKKKVFNKKYRLIYNQDCTNIFIITQEPIQPGHIYKMVDEIADGGADLMLINPNAQKINYPGSAWEKFWDCYTENLPHYVRQMKRLAELGYDYLSLCIERCRERGIAPGVSIRMNDMHGALEPDTSPLNSNFYKQNPQYRLPGKASEGWGRIGLNYEHSQVRQHYLNLIAEIVEKYDFDVLELDFLRFPNYFPRCNSKYHCKIMTDFIGQVRQIMLKKNSRTQLFIRVASVPALCYELGFDLSTLSKKNLIDGITFSEFLNTGWEMPVEEFRNLIGDRIALFAGADVSADRRPGLPVRYMPYNELLLEGFAYAYLSSGADGIYFFNFFTLRGKNNNGHNLRFDVFKKIKNQSKLKGCPKVYLISSNIDHVPDTDLPKQIPVSAGPRMTKEFFVLMGKEPNHSRVLLKVLFSGEILAEKLLASLNSLPLGHPEGIKDISGTSTGLMCSKKISGTKTIENLKIAEFEVPARTIVNGWNKIILRNESNKEVTISGIEIFVL